MDARFAMSYPYVGSDRCHHADRDGVARSRSAVLKMRVRCPDASALVFCCTCLSVLGAAPVAAQEAAPSSAATNWWLSLGAGKGTAGQTTDVGAVAASAWYSQGVFVGGLRTAALAPLINGDKSQDMALLVGLRTPPSFAAIVGAVGFSLASTQCAFAPCPAGYSSSASRAVAYSAQGRLNFNHFGIGVELLGANGSSQNHFSAAVVSLQVGSFKH